AMRRFGSEVTVIDRHERLVYREDEDVSREMRQLFEDEGIHLCLGATPLRIEGVSGDGVKIVCSQNVVDTVAGGRDRLVATGRIPNTRGIGIEAAGVELSENGYIAVNERLQTTAENVWAVGECGGSPHFTHIAFDDFRIVRDNISGGSRSTKGRQVP